MRANSTSSSMKPNWLMPPLWPQSVPALRRISGCSYFAKTCSTGHAFYRRLYFTM